jgi:hypothetical protein
MNALDFYLLFCLLLVAISIFWSFTATSEQELFQRLYISIVTLSVGTVFVIDSIY